MTRCKDCVVNLFGVCNPDYCYQERQGLVERAEDLAGQQGHTLTQFVKAKGLPIWHATCTRCGLRASICLDPQPGETDVYGAALTTPCSESDET
jgi:hypothetical protein